MHLPLLLRRTAPAVPLALLALALPAAGAHAATLAQAPDGAIVYTGGAGATQVSFDLGEDGRVRVAPTLGDPLTAAPPACEIPEDDPYLAHCTVEQAGGLRVVMGDGDDVARVHAPLAVPVVLDGGAGADVLSGVYEGGAETLLGGPGNYSLDGRGGDDVVDGGDGDDALKGGPGADTVLGGEGGDTLSGDDDASVSGDVLDGGAGVDLLEQEWSTVGREGRGPVAVTLADGDDDGFPDERDDVRRIERVHTHTGGRYAGTDGPEELLVGGDDTTVEGRGGDDTIHTSYGADTIDGGTGADVLRGYAGDDRITGGPGQDTIAGDTVGQACNVLTCTIHSGNDVIDARDGERDSIDCGLGTDTALVDRVDVAANCEDVRVDAPGVVHPPIVIEPPVERPAPRVSLAGRSLRTALARGFVVRVSGQRPGRLSVVIRRGRLVVARGTVRVAAQGTGRAVLRVTKTGRRALRRASRATLRVSAGSARATVRLAR